MAAKPKISAQEKLLIAISAFNMFVAILLFIVKAYQLAIVTLALALLLHPSIERYITKNTWITPMSLFVLRAILIATILINDPW